ISGRVAVPTFDCRLGTALGSIACAPTPAEAIISALTTALHACQARSDRHFDYAPPSLGEIPQPAVVTETPQGSLVNTATSGDLLDTLHRAGHDIVVVPLDHDTFVAGLLPFVVHVIGYER
ncbi:hypothetical protein, partial [Nocardia sp. NPDC058497]|uniref:hypothetical protein n=1 Tax=Nocardia sp. NPDC058497 TaxID=3346529 RepID=UPI00364A38C7